MTAGPRASSRERDRVRTGELAGEQAHRAAQAGPLGEDEPHERAVCGGDLHPAPGPAAGWAGQRSSPHRGLGEAAGSLPPLPR